MPQVSFYHRSGKRVFDLLVAVPLMALIWLPLLLVAFCSLLVQRRPVLFRQRRAGYKGMPFTLYKFRSMTDRRDAYGNLLPDASRLTPWGLFLRRSSIDELPALWNVIKGEMSLIGPRPLPVEYTEFYNEEQAKRLWAMPGIAGYAALFGRNAQSWESIFERDVWYVDHVSFLLDLRIIFGILGVILRRSGIDRGAHNRNSPFQERIDTAAQKRNNASGN